MKVEYTAAAQQDLASILAFVAERNSAAARRLALRIRTSIDRLERLPFSARRRRIDGTRLLVVSGTHYFVIYRVTNERVEILRVYHDARNVPR